MNLTESEGKASDGLIECINTFTKLSQNLDEFVACDPQKSQKLINLTKKLFDQNKQIAKQICDKKSNLLLSKTSLDQLFTSGFDEEQIWQQIQLQNEPLLNALVKEVADVTVRSDRLTLRPETEEKQKDNEIEIQPKAVIDSKKVDKKLNEVDSKKKKYQKKVRIVEPIKKSIVDDKFFKLDQLEQFLNNEDLKEEQRISGVEELMSEESDEEIDYFEDPDYSDIDDNDLEDLEERPSARDAMFNDFFDPPIDDSQNADKSDEESEDVEEGNEEIDTRDVDLNGIDNEDEEQMGIDYESSDDSEDESKIKSIERQNESNDNKSEFERIQERLQEKIEKQERLNLMNKSWQMKGEIASDNRPENSLLEEHLHFDHTQRPAPMITEETTSKLEDIIKQRVKDNAFDDVVRKVKPKEKPFEYRRRITMESEKNKQSLAEVYESEYLKQKQTEREEQQNPVHNEIRRRMRTLFLQLDALSNFNFTPRPPQPEVKIINNLPAIHAEEVTPVTATDVSLLAPQEVFNNQKRELQTNEEKSKTDRNRSRRVKKKSQSLKSKYNESKEKPIKASKQLLKSSADTKHLSSSKKFFEILQEKSAEVVKKGKLEKRSAKSVQHSNKLKL